MKIRPSHHRCCAAGISQSHLPQLLWGPLGFVPRPVEFPHFSQTLKTTRSRSWLFLLFAIVAGSDPSTTTNSPCRPTTKTSSHQVGGLLRSRETTHKHHLGLIGQEGTCPSRAGKPGCVLAPSHQQHHPKSARMNAPPINF